MCRNNVFFWLCRSSLQHTGASVVVGHSLVVPRHCPTRNWTHTPHALEGSLFTTGPPGGSHTWLLSFVESCVCVETIMWFLPFLFVNVVYHVDWLVRVEASGSAGIGHRYLGEWASHCFVELGLLVFCWDVCVCAQGERWLESLFSCGVPVLFLASGWWWWLIKWVWKCPRTLFCVLESFEHLC